MNKSVDVQYAKNTGGSTDSIKPDLTGFLLKYLKKLSKFCQNSCDRQICRLEYKCIKDP